MSENKDELVQRAKLAEQVNEFNKIVYNLFGTIANFYFLKIGFWLF